jgi:hypothetical protein
VKLQVQLTKPVRAPVDISLSGPRDVRLVVKKGEPLLHTFELEHGEWQLLVRSEGCRNFKVPLTLPGPESVAVALAEIPKYWEKKQNTERRRLQKAEALQAKQANRARTAEQRKKRMVAEQLAREEAELRQRQVEAAASAQSESDPTAKEYEAAILMTKGMVEQNLAEMDWPAGSEPAEVLALLAQRLGEDGAASEFATYVGQLRSRTTSGEEEIAKLIFITRDIVLETSADQTVTLLKTAKSLCNAVPAANGTGQYLRLAVAALIFGMAHLNPK